MAERDRKPDRIARRFNSKRHCRWVVNPAIPKSLQTRQEVYILKSYVKWHQQAIHTRAFILINLILWKSVIEKITFVSKKNKQTWICFFESMISMSLTFCLPMSYKSSLKTKRYASFIKYNNHINLILNMF